MARRSWNVSPGDCCRSFWNAWKSAASRASTMRLRTPRPSMNAITCACAPAPIDSIDSTAATPKIIPSMVNSVRSLWSSRFSKLRPRSGSSTEGASLRAERSRCEVIAGPAAAPARQMRKAWFRRPPTDRPARRSPRSRRLRSRRRLPSGSTSPPHATIGRQRDRRPMAASTRASSILGLHARSARRGSERYPVGIRSIPRS